MSKHANSAESYSPVDFALQSTPRHVAIIMDGNRRWAKQHKLPATVGYRAGINRLKELLPLFARSQVETLTLFAFSAANWQRSECEVSDLLRLSEQALRQFAPLCLKQKIRVEMIGRRDRLPKSLIDHTDLITQQTAHGDRRLRIAFDYSSRESILAAAAKINGDRDAGTLSQSLGDSGDVDLLIRTGKEQRLSDFLLWECAFAELYFPDLYWPDFTAQALETAMSWYAGRNRTFGA
jgi:undecaprenyl diphosphate synthase